MTSKERILAALNGGETDYVPLIIGWNENQKLHERLSWKNERERLRYASEQGWDTSLRVSATVTPAKSVSVRQTISEENGVKTLSQSWETPAVTLEEKLRLTDDWDRSELSGKYLGLCSDFRTTRYISYALKNESDIAALEYIFPEDNPDDTERIKESYAAQRALADEFGYPLFAYLDSGLDWLMWLYPLAEGAYRAVDEPGNVRRILEYINRAKHKRLELLLSLGVDGVNRRGWYECTDIWSPELLRQFTWPTLEREIEMTHAYDKAFIYTIDTGAKGIATDLNAMGIDCFQGLDPVRGDMTVKEIREAFPEKTLWGGFSAAVDFAAETPERAVRAVEEAIAVYGRRRLILGMAASFRYYYPWENYAAAEAAWKRLR